MRLKFFLTIFVVLIVATISISSLHFYFFKQERLRLIEINLQQNATLILDNDLTLTKKEFSRIGKEYIEEIIGDDKVNMIVAIYQKNGSLLYHNNNAIIFETPDYIGSHFNEWEDVETKEHFIKYLTIRDLNQNRIIRVGMILNQSLLRWKNIGQSVRIYGLIILMIITLISYFLTYILFKPIQKLANHINLMTEKLEHGDTSNFNSVLHISKNRFNNDEFSVLLKSISKLSLKISESHNITKKWSALMAHELKTPLTILRNRVESLAITGVEEEMMRLEKIIVSFLDWAALESDPAKPEIHAISIKKRCAFIIGSLKEAFPDGQIEIRGNGSDEARLFCNPIHFDQMLFNLLTNALKYGNGSAVLECNDNSLEVIDAGPGIPDEVINKLGTPFNYLRSGNVKGFGLGLAWVTTVCKKYGWTLEINPKEKNRILISFATSVDVK